MNTKEFFKIIDKDITIVDFYAVWCAPCKGQSIVITYMEKEFQKKNIKDIKFIQFDVDKNIDVASNFEIRNIPTIIIFKDGEEQLRFIGITNNETLTSAIQKIQKGK